MFTSHPDYLEILQNAGYLFVNPTNLSVGESGWGTKLGFVRDGVQFDPGIGFIELDQPETGDEPVIGIFTGSNAKVIAPLRNYNINTLSVLFPGLASSATVKVPNTIKTGTNLYTSHSCRLLYVPEDQTNHPCLLLQKAIPRIHNTARLKFSQTDPIIFPAVFTAARKTSDVDGIWYLGALSGAVLR